MVGLQFLPTVYAIDGFSVYWIYGCCNTALGAETSATGAARAGKHGRGVARLQGAMFLAYISDVWLDILSIPQRNDTLNRLAVNSLYTHARQADTLVTVKSESVH